MRKIESMRKIGLSIFYTTLPKRETDMKGFLENSIFNIFENYKNGIKEATNYDISSESEDVYSPKIYYLFGRYDLAILSLVDDLEFSTKSFMPFNSFKLNDYTEKAYDYKTLTGIINYGDKESPFGDNNYYFIGLSRLKVNSAFLIGNGNVFIQKAIKKIKKIKKIKNNKYKNIKLIISNSFSYSELTLVITSNSLDIIRQFIQDIRKIKIKEITDFEEITKHSLANILIDNKICKSNKVHLSDNHLFDEVISTLGFDITLLLNKESEISIKENLNVSLSLGIKPGHVNNFIEETCSKGSICSKYLNSNSALITIGKNDLTFQFSKISFKEYITILKEIIIDNINILRINTDVYFNGWDKNNKIDNDCHFDILGNLTKKMMIPFEKRDNVRKKTRAIGLSIILSQQILSMISVYNTNISFLVHYTYFIEFYGFIQGIISYIDRIYDNLQNGVYVNKSIVEKTLTKNVIIFERAYNNRFFQSFSTNEITEFDLTYKGGIHQLLSTYNAIYLFYPSLLSKNISNNSIAYIDAYSDTKSTGNSVRLNYFHIFQPSFFLCVGFHEAANYFIDNLLSDIIEIELLGKDKKHFIEIVNDIDTHKLMELLCASGIKAYKNETSMVEIKNLMICNNTTVQRDYSEVNYLNKGIPIEDNKVKKFLNSIYLDELYRYIIVDMLTFKLSYLSDFELFSYWHWIFFLQQSFVYETYTKIEDSEFISMFIRIEFIKQIYKIENAKTIPDNLLQSIHYNNDVKHNHIKQLNEKYRKLISKAVSYLTSHPEVKEFIAFFKNDIIGNVLRNMEFEEINKQIITNYINDLKKGSIIKISRSESHIEKKVSEIIYAYLKYFVDEFKKNKNKSKILYREPWSGKVFYTKKTNSLSIDPRGGFFVAGKMRLEYFNVRMSILGTFWHFSQIQKLKYIKSFI